MTQEMRLQCIHFVHFLTHHVNQNEICDGLQGFQYDGYFCDTTLYFVSPGLDVPGAYHTIPYQHLSTHFVQFSSVHIHVQFLLFSLIVL